MKKFKTVLASLDGKLTNVTDIKMIQDFRAETYEEFQEFLINGGVPHFAFTLEDVEEKEVDN